MRHIYIMSKKSHFRSQEMSNLSTYQNEMELFIFDWAEAYACAHFSRKLPARIGALFVNRAQTRLRMQKIAVAIWALSEHEEFGSLTIRGNIAIFFKSFGHFFYGVGGFVFACDAQTNQIERSDFNRH